MQRTMRLILLAVVLFGTYDCVSLACDSTDSQIFRNRMVPILVEKCIVCHGGESTEGSYSVSDTRKLFVGGESGASPVSTLDPESSEILVRVTSLDSTLRMPLDAEPLSASEIDDMRRWLLSGAKVDDNQQPVSLVEIYGQTKASARAPLFYPKPIPISSLLLSQDGRLLLVGGYSEILIWNIEHQSLDFRLPTRGRMVTDIKWAAGGKLVVASGAPGKFGVLEAIDFATRKPIAAFGFSRDVCSNLSPSPYRNEIAAGFADGSVTIFSLEAYRPRVASVAHALGVTSVEWSSKNDRIFSASLDRTAKSFQTTDGQVLSAYPDHERAVGSVLHTQFGPVTLDETGTLRLWSDGEDVRSIAKLEGFPQSVQRIVATNGVIHVAGKDRIRRLTIVQDEIDDDKAKDKDKADQQKPKKKKKRTSFKELESLRSIPDQSILSVTTNANGFVAAGLDSGRVIVWHPGESTNLWKTWVSQP